MPSRIFRVSEYRIPAFKVLDRDGDEPLLEFYNSRTKKCGSVSLSEFIGNLIRFCSRSE